MFRKMIGRILGYEGEIADLKTLLKSLEWDETFGMFTRRAFIEICDSRKKRWRHLVFIDIDNMAVLNRLWGYDEVNRRIHDAFRALGGRGLAGRWFSGDEIALAFRTAEEALQGMRILKSAAAHRGFDFCHVHAERDPLTQTTEDVVSDLSKAVAELKRIKRMYGEASSPVRSPKTVAAEHTLNGYRSLKPEKVKKSFNLLDPDTFI